MFGENIGEPTQSDCSAPTVVYRISKTGNLESERLDSQALLHVRRCTSTLNVVSLPPVIAPKHMAKPRDPRVNRYLKLQSQRSSHAERLASQTLLRLAKQHDWLNTRSLIPIPRKLLTAEQKATMREAFDLVAANGDGEEGGTIGYTELTSTMKSLGFTAEDIRAAIAEGDHDGDGRLDFEEVRMGSRRIPRAEQAIGNLAAPSLHIAACNWQPCGTIAACDPSLTGRCAFESRRPSVLHPDFRAAAQGEFDRRV